MDELEDRLARWRRAGLITGSQADSIRAYERSRPRLRRPERAPAPGPAGPFASPTAAPRASPASPAHLPRPAAAPQPARGRMQPPGPQQEEPLIHGLPIAPDARLVGLAAAVLAVIGLIVGIFSVTVDLLIAPTHNVGGDLEDLLHLGASVIGLIGGARMAAGWAGGRRLVLAGLGINVVATLVLSLYRLTQGLNLIEVVFWIAFAVMVAAARFGRPAPVAQG